MYPAAEKALKIAKMHLMGMSNTCFYTTILFSLKQEFSTDIPTAGTNGIDLKINPDFWMKQNPKQQIGLLVHEVMHVALDHMGRVNDRDQEKWNIAGDHVINLSLLNNGYQLPSGGLHDYQYDNMSTEQVYAKLPIKPKQSDWGNDIDFSNGADQDDKNEIGNKVTEIVLRAVTQTQMLNSDPGNIPGEVLIQLGKRINPKLPWNVILQNYMSEYSKDDYSFSRPNKRFLPIYMPTARTPAITNIAVAVDASASVSDKEFTFFIDEINNIKKNLQPDKITVITFDTNIKAVQELTPDKDPFTELKFIGRGGTSITPVLDWAEENQPTVLLVFSDGEFYEQPAPHNVPIIWIIHDDLNWKCSYGKIIHYLME